MRFTSLCAGIFFAMLLSAWTLAETPQADAKALKFITLDVAPWASYAADGRTAQGAFVEMVREIQARTPYRIEVSLTPFARVDRELESGGHDCTIIIPRSESIVRHGELVSYHQIGVVPRRGVVVDSYRDLEGLKIALLRGAAITDRFDNDKSLHKVQDTDYLMSLRKLARARVDAVAGAVPTIRYLADTNGLGQALGESYTLAEVPLMFQCSKRSEHLEAMAEINAAIAAMKEDGAIERIREQYYF